MKECPRLSTCAYYNLEKANSSAVGKIMQECFCHGSRQSQCERLLYFNKNGEAPADEMTPDRNLNLFSTLYSEDMESRIDRTLKSLRKNGFEAKYFDHRSDALEYLIKECRGSDFISHGGAQTLDEIGFFERLAQEGMTYLPYHASPENRLKSLSADIYITSSNALTEDGRLVNIDGAGNRVAALCFGPRKVFVVIGTNKIVKNLEQGIERIRKIAAPFNAIRLKKHVPCTITGECVDCHAPDRICRSTVTTDHPLPGRITVILIDEVLGY